MVQQTLHFRSGNSHGINYRLQEASYKLQVTSYRLQLQITITNYNYNYRVQNTSYKLFIIQRSTKYKLQVTSYKLKVARVFKYREAAQPHFGEAEIR